MPSSFSDQSRGYYQPYEDQPLPGPLPLGPEMMSTTHLPEIYEVHFKRTMDLFVRGFTDSFNVGDYVKVEADRGFDLGVISVIFTPASPSYPYHNIPRRRVLGLASEDEKAFLLAKIDEEYRALDICRDLALRRGMKINVLDAELQYDRRKLTFLFTSEKHTDFRELVRDLFSIFKTRIWMQKINPAQAASLEHDCRNSHFPTLPTIDKYTPEPPISSPPRYPIAPTIPPPQTSPSTRVSARFDSTQIARSTVNHRSSSITSTNSGSTFDEEEEEEYPQDRSRRVGGIRGVRDENGNLSFALTAGAGTRSGVRGLGSLPLSTQSLGLPQMSLNPQRMALSLPHGLDGQTLYTGNHSDPSGRSNSGSNERFVHDFSDLGRSISLPASLPSQNQWSSHPMDPRDISPTTTTTTNSTISSLDNVFMKNIGQYSGIPISSQQLRNYELQQHKYLNEKYGSTTSHPVDTIISKWHTKADLPIDDVQINLSHLQLGNDAFQSDHSNGYDHSNLTK